jgi:hypothetical protein
MPPVAKLFIQKQMTKGAQCPNGVKEDEQTDSETSFESNDLSDNTKKNQENDAFISRKSKPKGNQMIFLGKKPTFFLDFAKICTKLTIKI